MSLRDTLVQAGFVMIATGAALAAWALVAGKDGRGVHLRQRPTRGVRHAEGGAGGANKGSGARSARSAPRSKKKK